MPDQHTSAAKRGLAAEIRRAGALVADLVGQAEIARFTIPTEVYSVQPTLLTWARRVEQ